MFNNHREAPANRQIPYNKAIKYESVLLWTDAGCDTFPTSPSIIIMATTWTASGELQVLHRRVYTIQRKYTFVHWTTTTTRGGLARERAEVTSLEKFFPHGNY